MVSSRDDLLMNLLGCGSLDLGVVDRVGYDFCDVLEQLDGLSVQNVGFNGLMRAVVEFGIDQMREAINTRVLELQGGPYVLNDLEEEEQEELDALNSLNPDEDIQSFHNFIDTHVWFENNGPIYRRYLGEAIDAFEEGTGLHITGGEADE